MHPDLPGQVKALGDVYSGEAQILKTTRKRDSHMASAQAWPFLPRLCFPGTVLAAGSLGGHGALLHPASQRRTSVFFSSSALLPLLLAPFICFLLSGISLPVYPPRQKMPVLLRRTFQKKVWVKIPGTSHSERKEIPIKWSNP